MAKSETQAPEQPGTNGQTPAEPEKEPNRYMVNIQVSKALKEAFGKWAESQNKSEASAARELIAQACGYDLSQEPASERGRVNPALKGLSEEQRKKAQAELRKARNDLIRKLLEGHEAELAAAEQAAVEKAKQAGEQPAPATA